MMYAPPSNYAAEGYGWCRHVNSCYSRNEQAISHPHGNPCAWARQVSIFNLQIYFQTWSSYFYPCIGMLKTL